MAKIYWAPELPPEIKSVVEPYIEEFKHMLPPWLSLFTIQYGRDNGTARNATKEEYRSSYVTFEAGFLDQPEWKRRADVLHEILHIVTDPLYTQAWDLKNLATEEAGKPVKEYIDEQLRLSLERTITDLTTCVLNTLEQARISERSKPLSSNR